MPDEQEQAVPVVHVLSDAEMAKFLNENPNAVKLNRLITPVARTNSEDYDTYHITWVLGSRVSGE